MTLFEEELNAIRKKIAFIFWLFLTFGGNICSASLIYYINYLKLTWLKTLLPTQNNSTSKSRARYFILYSGWRRSLFQDQEHDPAQKTYGCILPETKCTSNLTKLNVGNVRFLFDGERLHEAQTPKDLNMENGDEIDVVIEQVGGSQIEWWCLSWLDSLLQYHIFINKNHNWYMNALF